MEVFNGMTSSERSYIRTPNTPRKLIIYSFAKTSKTNSKRELDFLVFQPRLFSLLVCQKNPTCTLKFDMEPVKMGTWKTRFLLETMIFSFHVNLRVCNHGILKRKLVITSSELFLLRQGVELSALGAWLAYTDEAQCSEHLLSQGFKFTEKKRRNSPQKMVVWNLIELETPINGKPAHRPPLCWKENTLKIFRASKNRGSKNAQKLTQLVFFGIHPACRRAMHWDSDPRKVNASVIRQALRGTQKTHVVDVEFMISLVSWANMFQTQSIVKRKFVQQKRYQMGRGTKKATSSTKRVFSAGIPEIAGKIIASLIRTHPSLHPNLLFFGICNVHVFFRVLAIYLWCWNTDTVIEKVHRKI